MTINWDQKDKEEWNQLGFYYEVDDKKREWHIIADYKGVKLFCSALKEFSLNPLKSDISEHEHYGPYQYLKFVTWEAVLLRNDGIYAPQNQFKVLAKLVEDRLANGNQEIIIDQDFFEPNSYKLIIRVKERSFKPSDLDHCTGVI